MPLSNGNLKLIDGCFKLPLLRGEVCARVCTNVVLCCAVYCVLCFVVLGRDVRNLRPSHQRCLSDVFWPGTVR
jgi:hypothetical protein